MKKPSSVIAFRCPPEVTREIDEQCKPLNLSRGDWVRATILTRLHESNAQSLSSELQLLHEQLASLDSAVQGISRNLAKASFLMLTNEVMPKDQAKALVQRHLIQSGDDA